MNLYQLLGISLSLVPSGPPLLVLHLLNKLQSDTVHRVPLSTAVLGCRLVPRKGQVQIFGIC